jgi:hypothetical protein
MINESINLFKELLVVSYEVSGVENCVDDSMASSVV